MSTVIQLTILILLHLSVTVSREMCPEGHSCREPTRCCADTCCLPDHHHYHGFGFRWSIWNMWYFWFIVIFILMSCFGGCGYWRRRQLLLAQHQQHMMNHYESYPSSRSPYTGPHLNMPVFPASYDTAIFGSGGGALHNTAAAYPRSDPPQQLFPSPPPYSEVMSKPEMWPPSKDELPPYPGEPVITANQAQALANSTQAGVGLGSEAGVPGLPPYSATEPIPPSSGGDTASCAATASHPSDISGRSRAISSSTNNHNTQINTSIGHMAPSSVPDVNT